MKSLNKCVICSASLLDQKLDFGQQPIGSHFRDRKDKTLIKKPVALAICSECQTIQLERPVPWRMLTPPFDWITYREPEEHLDDLVKNLSVEIPKSAKILGLSFKDQTVLDRLNTLGFSNTHLFAPLESERKQFPNANIESVAPLFSRRIKSYIENMKWDVIIARHVIEHAEHTQQFVKELRSCLTEKGFLVGEVPDCQKNIERGDVAMIWEEHVTYFTERSVKKCLEASDLSLTFIKNYPLPFENCLVFFAAKKDSATLGLPQLSNVSREPTVEFENYINQIKLTTKFVRQKLENVMNNERKVAAYGAGHLLASYINLNGFHDLISLLVDDDAKKQGMFLPGTDLKIDSPVSLLDNDVGICLLGLSVELEEKIINKNIKFEEQGGKFYSILKASPRSIFTI